MRTSLELLRILIILIFFGGLGWAILKNIYTMYEVPTEDMWVGSIAIFIIIFVLYRNKLQFSGWYKGKSKEKLPKNVSLLLILLSFLLLITPIVVSSF